MGEEPSRLAGATSARRVIDLDESGAVSPVSSIGSEKLAIRADAEVDQPRAIAAASRPEPMDPSGVHALDAWALSTNGAGEITIAGEVANTDAMRALWSRLGVLLGQTDREVNPEGWEALRRKIDTEYLHALPVRADLRRPASNGRKAATKNVAAALYRCDDRTAAVRVGVFEAAFVHPLKRKDGSIRWEGGVRTFWPGSFEPQSRFNGQRVVVTEEAVFSAPCLDPEMGRIVVRRTRLLVDLSTPVGRGSPARPPVPRAPVDPKP